MSSDLRPGLINGTDMNLSQYITAVLITGSSYGSSYKFTLNQDILWPQAYSLPNDYVISLMLNICHFLIDLGTFG